MTSQVCMHLLGSAWKHRGFNVRFIHTQTAVFCRPYFPTNGKDDMFWDQGALNISAIAEGCQRDWGVVPRQQHMLLQFGGLAVQDATQIVW